MSSVIFRRTVVFRPHVSHPFRLSSTSSQKPRSNKVLSGLSLAAALTLTTTAYTLGSIYPPPTLSLIFPRPAPPPPTDPTSSSSLAYIASLEAQLQSLPLLTALRTQPDAASWYEVRPYKTLPDERRANNLLAGALHGPGRLALPPVLRMRADGSEAWAFVHVGRGVCGHDGVVHGGLLAMLLDESLARIAIANLPAGVGVTANLAIDYRAPTMADQFIVLKTRLIESKGRKAVVGGRVEDIQGTLLAEATAVFVQPKYAKLLSRAALKQILGEPEPPVHLVDGVKA